MSPAVYATVDARIGGINIAKLALHSSIILSLWYLRRAVLEAIMPAQLSESWRCSPSFWSGRA